MSEQRTNSTTSNFSDEEMVANLPSASHEEEEEENCHVLEGQQSEDVKDLRCENICYEGITYLCEPYIYLIFKIYLSINFQFKNLNKMYDSDFGNKTGL